MFFVAEATMLRWTSKFDILLKYLRSRFFYSQVEILCRLIFAGEKVWRCSSFPSVSSLAWFVAVECRENVRSFRCFGKAFSFFMAARFVYFDFFCLTMKSLFFQRWCFFFSIAEEEIRNLSSLKSCRCLQAQWWKAKSLLDRWNLPSGYVSSMESNCWSSKNFLSVD